MNSSINTREAINSVKSGCIISVKSGGPASISQQNPQQFLHWTRRKWCCPSNFSAGSTGQKCWCDQGMSPLLLQERIPHLLLSDIISSTHVDVFLPLDWPVVAFLLCHFRSGRIHEEASWVQHFQCKWQVMCIYFKCKLFMRASRALAWRSG
jgi:hypothetical protein